MKKKTALRDNIVSLLLGFAGQSNTLTIPRPFINLCNGDHLAALLLSQILYWQERTEDKAGWFAKSYEDWYDELGLTEYQIKRIIQGDKRNKNQICKLSDLGIETSLRRSKFYKGAATLHYRVNMAVFRQRVLNIVQNDDVSNVQNDDANIVPERITTETTSEIITTAATADDVPTTDEKPMTFDDFPEMDWSTVKNRQQQMKEVVHQVWGFPVGSTRNTMFEMMLRGKSDNKTVKDGNIPPEYGKRFEPYELGDWHDWYLANGIKSDDKVMPTSAPIIQASIMEWIDAGKPKGKVQSKPANNRPVVTVAPADNSPVEDRAAIADLLAAGRRALETDGVS